MAPVPKVIFSSDELPAHLDNRARFKLWRDIHVARYGECDFAFLPDRPFRAYMEFGLFDRVNIGAFNGTRSRVALTARHIAASKDTQPLMGLLLTRSPVLVRQSGRELAVERGQVALCTNIEPAELLERPDDDNGTDYSWVSVPPARLSELVASAEDLIAVPIDTATPAMRHLRRYLAILREGDGIDEDAALLAHIDTTLIDLVALALGAGRDAAQIARMRGLRAARTQEIIAEIKASFAEPDCSPARIALKVGVSPRYLHELLQETGSSFGDRVLELRLQKARIMLSGARHDRLKVSDIALACGFNEVSYFNRAFRRRFGASPTQYRGSGGM
jgi:AraC-like DNA-binding protein